MKKHRLISERQTMTKNVLFMERDDNSTCLSDKKDVHKDGKEQKQKRILKDYIINLHRKFLAENSNTKINLAVLGRMRRKHISIVKFSDKKKSFMSKASKHGFKFKSFESKGMSNSENPET